MKINLANLAYQDKIEINEKVEFDASYFENSDILGLENVYVEGIIYQNDLDEYYINIDVKGTMYLTDSVTLDKVPYDFAFTLDDNFENLGIKDENTLDIIELLWENIVLEEPISYTLSDADNLKGDNWQVINDD